MYTHKYPPPSCIARARNLFAGQLLFDPTNDASVLNAGAYKRVPFVTTAEAIGGSETQVLPFGGNGTFCTPIATNITLFVVTELLGGAKSYIYDDCLEVLVRPVSYQDPEITRITAQEIANRIVSPPVVDHVGAAWIWGSGFAASEPWPFIDPNGGAAPSSGRIVSVSAPPAQWEVLVRCGMIPGKTSSNSTLNVNVYALLGTSVYPTAPFVDVASACCVPPFCVTEPNLAGTYLFSQAPAFPYPADQNANGDRIWRSKVFSIPATADALAMVAGGPWKYSVSAATDANPATGGFTAKFSDASPLYGFTVPGSTLPVINSTTGAQISYQYPAVGNLERTLIEVDAGRSSSPIVTQIACQGT